MKRLDSSVRGPSLAYLLVGALAVLMVTPSALAQERPNGKKYALLVAVDRYEEASLLPGLLFPRRDIDVLEKVFLAAGYEKDNVVVMTRERGLEEFDLMPTSEHIKNQLELLLGQLTPGDSVVVALAGHGVMMLAAPAGDPDGQPRQRSFFCPMDANLAHKQLDRFLSFDVLYKALEGCKATVKLLPVDACRNELSAQPEGRPGGIAMPPPPLPPPLVAALFSCSDKGVSWEDEDLDGGHSVFFHHVINGLKGAADRDHDNKISIAELVSYAQDKVPDHVSDPRGKPQTPILLGRAGGVTQLDLGKITAADLITTRVAGIELKLIRAGEFLMGSPEDDKDAEDPEKPQHRIRITRPFYLGVYEVTQAQYQAVMDVNPSGFSAGGRGKDKVAGLETSRLPVENVSWLDAVTFCNKLSEREDHKPFYEINGKNVNVPDWNGLGYRLPTEAEWEYACRGGARTTTRYSFGDDAASLREFGWFGRNSEGRTHSAGEKRGNGFGLFDMHGNVWEWCWDAYAEDYYKRSPVDDPRGADRASGRVNRGGAWKGYPRLARSACRDGFPPVDRFNGLGFRLARGQSGG
jgi:formylglycine-generating enzyme required for sulfatase activity